MEEQLSPEEIAKITGCTVEELNQMASTDFGQRTIDFLAQWVKITTQSLKANRLILTNCLVTEAGSDHILCRFCGEGIPNWKRDNAREHTSECPMTEVSDALMAVRSLQQGLEGLQNDEHSMPGRSIT
tara:strand:+ start:318 stop:701 length:384 start_codon:yes stop_codon:yes gene_type:complete